MQYPRNRLPCEESIQIGIAEYLRDLGLLFTATCGGIDASISQKAKMKRTGYNRGVPDLLIFEPRGDKHGLCLEVKSQYGVASMEQKDWIEQLNQRGYHGAFVRSVREAKNVIDKYLISNSENEETDGEQRQFAC